MVDLDAHADRRLAGLENAAERFDRGLFEECDEPWRAEHFDVAGTEGAGGIGLANDEPGFALQSDRYVHRRQR